MAKKYDNYYESDIKNYTGTIYTDDLKYYVSEEKNVHFEHQIDFESSFEFKSEFTFVCIYRNNIVHVRRIRK